jgi:hypothetical protein
MLRVFVELQCLPTDRYQMPAFIQTMQCLGFSRPHSCNMYRIVDDGDFVLHWRFEKDVANLVHNVEYIMSALAKFTGISMGLQSPSTSRKVWQWQLDTINIQESLDIQVF